jgi:calcium-translocating P-type ATPase
MRRMLKKNVLVRKLVGIETAGSINILFTDKTGTLTEGKLCVKRFIDTNFNEYESINKIKINDLLYEVVYQSLVYNNNSFFNNKLPEGGNTTDRAVLSFVGSDDKSKYKILDKLDFNSKLKYSSVTTTYNGKTTFFKGAYEKIMDKCNFYLNNGQKRVLLEKEKYEKYINDRTFEGERVLALAISENKEFERLTLVGFIFIKDNIRKNAYEGIRTIKNAGIDVVMVTGDSKETAYAIAKDLKIIENENDLVLTSEEFNNLSDEEAKKIISKLKILSRSLPQDKNRLVSIAQEMNFIVGMTGDGVNDAPALKRADVGFAMGSGTEVAKETSDIVILDDNISSIATAILYGRTIFKSIRKFVIFQLSVNVCAVLLNIIGPFIGVLSPITVIQVLWINMVMDTLAGLAFAFEPALPEYMEELPKKRDENIINSYMKNQIIFNGLYSTIICIWFLKSPIISSIYRSDPSNKYIMTAFFGLFIFLAIFNAFNARTYRLNTFSNIFKNKVFLFIILLITVIQVVLIYGGGEIFRTTGLTVYEFEIMIFLSLSIIPFDFIRKYILRKNGVERCI